LIINVSSQGARHKWPNSKVRPQQHQEENREPPPLSTPPHKDLALKADPTPHTPLRETQKPCVQPLPRDISSTQETELDFLRHQSAHTTHTKLLYKVGTKCRERMKLPWLHAYIIFFQTLCCGTKMYTLKG
jgi:hypothetical protein